MTSSIQSLMLKEHKRILSFLEKLEREIDNFEKTNHNYNNLLWNLEKHFFLEERAIFNMFVMISGQETDNTFNLLQDHTKLMSILKSIGAKLDKKIIPNITELKNNLTLHKSFENEYFYPLLDERITPEQKNKLAKKIKQVILD